MMNVKFTVTGQRLKRITTPYLVKDSQNYINLDFCFMTKDWSECEKKAIFNGEYEEPIVNDAVKVPASCLKDSSFTVSVYGVTDDGMRITTNSVILQLHISGYVPDASPALETQIEDLKNQVNELEADNADLQSANTSLLTRNADLVESNVELSANNEALQNANDSLSERASGLENQVEELTEDLTEKSQLAKFHGYIQEYLNKEPTRQNYAFYQNEAIKEVVDFDFSARESFSNQFNGCAGVERIVIENHIATNYARAFTSCSSLKSVKTLDFTYVGNASGWQNNCNVLEELLFVPESISVALTIPSGVLNDESIQSIVDGLAYVETAKELTLHTDVVARLTDEQMSMILSKNWSVT